MFVWRQHDGDDKTVIGKRPRDVLGVVRRRYDSKSRVGGVAMN